MNAAGPTRTTEDAYEIRQAGPRDLAPILDLLRANLSDAGVTAKTEAFWRWKHVETPAGPSIVYVACGAETGNVIGLRAALRIELVGPDGTVIHAVRPVDTVTHQDWQRKGIFSKLTLRLIEGLRHGSTKLLFNTPNENSLPAYLKLGWRVAQTCKIRVKLGSPSQLLSSFRATEPHSPWEKVLGDGTKLSVDQFISLPAHERHVILETSAEYEHLRTRMGLRSLRDATTLDWRYSHPTADYRVFRMQGADSIRPDAVVFFRYEMRKRIRGALLTDFFHDPTISFKQVLKIVCRSIAAGFFVASAMDGSHEDAAFARLLFMPLRQARLAQRPVDLESDKLPESWSSWDFSLSDLELF